MSSMFEFIGGLVATQIFFPDVLNQIVDKMIPFYTIFAMILIVVYFRRYSSQERNDRTYTVAKKQKESDEPKIITPASFVANWDKIERPGFKEFAIFMGQNSFVAGMAEKQPFGNSIQMKEENGKTWIKIDFTGIPSQSFMWCELGKDANAPISEGKDKDGSVIYEKFWWIEEEKKLMRVVSHAEGNPKGLLATQERIITPDDKMIARVEAMKMNDKSSAKFTTTFVRK